MTNFIQLSNNLNEDFVFYLRFKKIKRPLAKITFTAAACYLYPGKRGMSKKQIFKLVRHIHHRNIPLWMVADHEKIPVYGLQVAIEQKQALLL